MVQTEQTSRTHQTDVKVTCLLCSAVSLRPRPSRSERLAAADMQVSLCPPRRRERERPHTADHIFLILPTCFTTVFFFFFLKKHDLIFLFWSQTCENVPPEQLKNLRCLCVCVCVCVHACVYSGMPPNAGSVADPLLPYINPESIHLWAEP